MTNNNCGSSTRTGKYLMTSNLKNRFLFRLVFVLFIGTFLVLPATKSLAQSTAPPTTAPPTTDPPTTDPPTTDPPKQEKSKDQESKKDKNEKSASSEDSSSEKKPTDKDSKQDDANAGTDPKPGVDKESKSNKKSDDDPKTDTDKNDKPKQVRIRNKNNKENSSTLGLFKNVVANQKLAIVQVMQDKKRRAYGSIIDNTGLVLTKASELRKPLFCKFSDGNISEATVIGVDPETDLALLQTSARMLPTISFNIQMSEPEVGNWIAVPGSADLPAAIGIVSVANRKIPAAPGFMGIEFDVENTHKRGVIIKAVRKGLPADNAGLKDGDILINVEGVDTPDRMKVVELVMPKPPGSKIVVKVLRGKSEKESIHEIILGNREELDENMQRANYQNTMGNYRLSDRRKNFPTAFRHDGFLRPDECGGPVVDLDGKVIGVNIARGGRVESLALPNSIVAKTIEKLKTRKFAPAVVNKAKIEILEEQLAKIKKAGDLEKKKARASNEFDTQDALVDELKTIIRSIEKRLADAESSKDDAKSKLDTIKQQLKSKTELLEELEMLTKGIK